MLEEKLLDLTMQESKILSKLRLLKPDFFPVLHFFEDLRIGENLVADVFGMGSHLSPMVPYFGPWQSGGVLIGQVAIAIGFLMMIPYHLYLRMFR